jgi:small subunit ribosomal protein S9
MTINKNNKYIEGVGRRKNATARVRIYSGQDTSTVNGKPLEGYFSLEEKLLNVIKPLKVTELQDKYFFTALVKGGGVTGQSEAIQLGLARALYKMDSSLKTVLRKNGLVTRDSRMVESKKYNYKKARKKPQFSKR